MDQKIWTVMELVRCTTDYFTQKGIDSARLDAELLLAHVLDIERIQLYIHFDRPLEEREVVQYRQLVKRRVSREPVAYILGQKEFWSLPFKVNPQVLIPRPETEILLETALDLSLHLPCKKNLVIVDLCTGSGCLAVCLAVEVENAQLFATDISQAALDIAHENAECHGVNKRITFRQGDLFGCLEDVKGQVNLLVSNPPYVTDAEMANLQPEVKCEPSQALAAGVDGLDVYKKIADQAGNWIKKDGYICLEIGAKQAEAVGELLSGSGFHNISVIKDHANLDRVITAQKI